MSLPIGVLMLCAGFLLLAVALLGGRNPKPPLWASETIMSNLMCPLIIGLLALGCTGVIQTLLSEPRPALYDYLLSAGIAAAGIVAYLLLGVRKKLKGFAAADTAGTILEGHFGRHSQEPTPPSSENNLPKAA